MTHSGVSQLATQALLQAQMSNDRLKLKNINLEASPIWKGP